MMCIHIHFQEKKYFRKKNAEITRFDGTYHIQLSIPQLGITFNYLPYLPNPQLLY